ncbi:MAG: hypothetical protein QG658_640 [Patescibacteria group bacterium]|jgi:hypothetical protein|nr:hypothetical protein [Patescibacteria group bacterium]
MATTIPMLVRWFSVGVEQGATHMIVVCDTFDWEDYPIYVKPGEDVHEKFDEFHERNMQKVMEVYDLRLNRDDQMAERRALHF